MTDVSDIERMTMYEYEIRMTVYKLKRIDREKTIHEQAWANNQVKATRSSGKKSVPVYTTFKKFFDYEKYEKEILGNDELPHDEQFESLMRRANS